MGNINNRNSSLKIIGSTNLVRAINSIAITNKIIYGKTSNYFESKLKLARSNKNRFLLIGKDISYTQYARLKSFPILKLGNYAGGRMDSISCKYFVVGNWWISFNFEFNYSIQKTMRVELTNFTN